MTATLEHEKEQVKALFERVEAVEEVAHDIQASSPGNAVKLREVAERALGDAPPVRLKTAARLLALSDRTVRTWVSEGVLQLREEHPQRVDLVRLHEVLHLVQDLRAAGRQRDLLSAVWHRLQDAALLERADLQRSLEQLRQGEVTPAETAEEEALTRR